eukprot:jgi/Mesvir1/5328/Mv15418-RA.1
MDLQINPNNNTGAPMAKRPKGITLPTHQVTGCIKHVGVYTPRTGTLKAYNVLLVDKSGKDHVVTASVDETKKEKGFNVNETTFPLGRIMALRTTMTQQADWCNTDGFAYMLTNEKNMQLHATMKGDDVSHPIPFYFTYLKALPAKLTAGPRAKAYVDVCGIVKTMYTSTRESATARTRVTIVDSAVPGTANAVSMVLFDDARSALLEVAKAGEVIVLAVKTAKASNYQGNVTMMAGNTSYVTVKPVPGAPTALHEEAENAMKEKEKAFAGLEIVDESPLQDIAKVVKDATPMRDEKTSYYVTMELQLLPTKNFADPRKIAYLGCTQKARNATRTCRKALQDGACPDNASVTQAGQYFFWGGCIGQDQCNIIDLGFVPDTMPAMLCQPPISAAEWVKLDVKDMWPRWNAFLSSNRWTIAHVRVRPRQPGFDAAKFVPVSKDYYWPELDKEDAAIEWADFDWDNV